MHRLPNVLAIPYLRGMLLDQAFLKQLFPDHILAFLSTPGLKIHKERPEQNKADEAPWVTK